MSDLPPLDVDLAAAGGLPLLRLHLLAEAHRLGASPDLAAVAAEEVNDLHVADPVTPRVFLAALDEIAVVLERLLIQGLRRR